MAPFSKAIVELGGLERVYLLIMIARFDMNRDGSISQQEFESARIQGEKCVSNAVTGCANFAIISALQRGQSALWAVCPSRIPRLLRVRLAALAALVALAGSTLPRKRAGHCLDCSSEPPPKPPIPLPLTI